jgi:hypothetical protein
MSNREIVVNEYCREHGWSSYQYRDDDRSDVERRRSGFRSPWLDWIEYSGGDGIYVVHEENYERAGINATPR